MVPVPPVRTAGISCSENANNGDTPVTTYLTAATTGTKKVATRTHTTCDSNARPAKANTIATSQ